MSKLKRCPFCGGEAHTREENFTVCDSCLSGQHQVYESDTESAVAWNTRHENTCQNCYYWDKVEQHYDPRQYGECGKHISTTPSNLTVEDFGCNKFKEKE